MMSLAATATVVLMLVLLAALFIVISGLNAGLAFIESKVAVTAQLEDGTSGGQREELTAETDAMQRLREAYEATGRKLDLGTSTNITLFASLEINLTDPNASGAVVDALSDHAHIERI